MPPCVIECKLAPKIFIYLKNVVIHYPTRNEYQMFKMYTYRVLDVCEKDLIGGVIKTCFINY